MRVTGNLPKAHKALLTKCRRIIKMYYRNMRQRMPRTGYRTYGRRRTYRSAGYGMRGQAYRSNRGPRAGFARSRMTRRFIVGGSRW
ncbi:TPA_asm: hypothetical protein [Microviridae sp.]|nr:TPA_asm: hypothetical protein [Microviridae sp.]DAZ92331.1 TPA_asm: hypothetical protein [Microviridae sp.]